MSLGAKQEQVPRTAEQAGQRFVEAYYEHAERTWRSLHWLGVPIRKIPLDLWMLQEIVAETRPQLVIETGVDEGGSTLFFATLFDLLGEGQVVAIDVDLSRVPSSVRLHPRIELIEASSTDPAVVSRLAGLAEGRRVMVDLDSDHRRVHVRGELRALAPLVTPGCYLVVEDGAVNGHPIEPGFGPGPLEALEEWLEQEQPPFDVDPDRERLLATWNPRGYLRRCGGSESFPAAVVPATLGNGARAPELASELERLSEEAGRLREQVDSLRETTGKLGFELRARKNQAAVKTEQAALAAKRIEELRRRIEGHERETEEAGWRDRERIEELERQLLYATVRLDRIRATLPVRAYERVRKLPPFSTIARRRAERYWAAVESRGG